MLDELTPDELFVQYLFGQRRVLGLIDQQVPASVMELVEQVVAQARREEWPIDAGVLQRYMRGELTEGQPPRDWVTNQEAEQLALEGFATVLEILRYRVDHWREQQAEPIRERPKNKRQRLLAGMLGPFVVANVNGVETPFCWACKAVQPYDLVMALRPSQCPDCGATTCHPQAHAPPECPEGAAPVVSSP